MENIMKKRRFCSIVVFYLFAVLMALAQTPLPIQLPYPQTEGGKPLMQALKARQSIRAFSKDKLPLQTVSNLLWAAFGINRPESKRRTAPSARNQQEIDIYVSMEEGLFLYEADPNTLRMVLAHDIRDATGTQSFVKDAPVNLIYVADLAKAPNASEVDKTLYSALDTGYISQNVYLFCASEGLATVARGLVDRPTLAKKMGLRPDQRIILAQSVGYPSH